MPLIYSRPPTETDPGYELHATRATSPAGDTMELLTHLPNVEKPHHRPILRLTLPRDAWHRLAAFLHLEEP